MMWFQSRLYYKFLALIVPLIVVAVALTAMLVTEISRRFSIETAKESRNLLSASIEAQVRAFLDEIRTSSKSIAGFVELARLDPWETMLVLHDFRDRIGFFHYVALVEPEGRVAYASSPDRERIERTYRALKFGKRMYETTNLSTICRSEKGLPVLYATSPVRVRGRLKWILLCEVDARRIWEVFASCGGLAGGRFELVDSSGKILASSNIQDAFSMSKVPFSYLKAAIRKQGPSGWTGNVEGEKMLIVTRALSGSDWILVFLQPYELLLTYKHAIYKESVLIAAFLISLCVGLGLWYTRRLLKPIQELNDSIEAISRGDFSRKVQAKAGDEVGNLARQFDRMRASLVTHMEREKRMAREAARLENLAAVGEAAGKVTHEIGNHLSNIEMTLDLYRGKGAAPDPHMLDTIERSVARVDELCRDFLRFTRSRNIRPEPLPVGLFLKSQLEQYGPRLRRAGVELRTSLPQDLPILHADPILLEHVFLNLIQNALDAMPSGGDLRISAYARDGKMFIDFADSGPGIPPEHEKLIFESFFTTKRNRGTGLGLSIVRAVLRAHGGEIRYVRSGKGACFRVELPVGTGGAGEGEDPPPDSNTVPESGPKESSV